MNWVEAFLETFETGSDQVAITITVTISSEKSTLSIASSVHLMDKDITCIPLTTFPLMYAVLKKNLVASRKKI